MSEGNPKQRPNYSLDYSFVCGFTDPLYTERVHRFYAGNNDQAREIMRSFIRDCNTKGYETIPEAHDFRVLRLKKLRYIEQAVEEFPSIHLERDGDNPVLLSDLIKTGVEVIEPEDEIFKF